MRVFSIELKAKMFTVLVATLMITGMTSAISQDMVSPDREGSNNIILEQSQPEALGFFEMMTGSLSITNVQERYDGGEKTSVKVKAVATKDFESSGAKKVVSMYKCADSSCNTPPPIDKPSEDTCDSEEWYPEYDDCVDQKTESITYNFDVSKGQSIAWYSKLDIPEEEAQYVLIGYIYKDGVATDVSEEKFIVGQDYQPDKPELNLIDKIKKFLNKYVNQITELVSF